MFSTATLIITALISDNDNKDRSLKWLLYKLLCEPSIFTLSAPSLRFIDYNLAFMVRVVICLIIKIVLFSKPLVNDINNRQIFHL